MSTKILVACALAIALAGGAWAQTVSVGNLECLPNEWNALLTAGVDPDIEVSDQVRLYFRRLNPTGAYYWVELSASGNGDHWIVFPKPEDRRQHELTDEWWELLQNRDWMEGRDREWLEDWLDSQDHEATEYFVAVVDSSGAETARSKTSLVPVRDRDECRVGLDPFQAGQADNLTIGETTELQHGHEVYHWLCDGIVTRVDFEGILRADEICRACVIAAWLPVVPAGAALIAGTTIEKREPRSISQVEP
jgi:hypothetical protein